MANAASAPDAERTANPPTPARAANGRKVTAILALMVCVVPLSLYAYNIERNLHARATLGEACRGARAARDERLTPELVATLFEDDAPVMLDAIRESVDRPCEEAASRLGVWHWNLKREYALPREPATIAHLAAALDRAKARCPRLMMQGFEELPGHVDAVRSARVAAEACAPLDRVARELSFLPEERYTAWQWTSRMAAVARSLEPSRRAGRRSKH